MLQQRSDRGTQHGRRRRRMCSQHSATVRMLMWTPDPCKRCRASPAGQPSGAVASTVSMRLASWEMTAAASGGICHTQSGPMSKSRDELRLAASPSPARSPSVFTCSRYVTASIRVLHGSMHHPRRLDMLGRRTGAPTPASPDDDDVSRK